MRACSATNSGRSSSSMSRTRAGDIGSCGGPIRRAKSCSSAHAGQTVDPVHGRIGELRQARSLSLWTPGAATTLRRPDAAGLDRRVRAVLACWRRPRQIRFPQPQGWYGDGQLVRTALNPTYQDIAYRYGTAILLARPRRPPRQGQGPRSACMECWTRQRNL